MTTAGDVVRGAAMAETQAEPVQRLIKELAVVQLCLENLSALIDEAHGLLQARLCPFDDLQLQQEYPWSRVLKALDGDLTVLWHAVDEADEAATDLAASDAAPWVDSQARPAVDRWTSRCRQMLEQIRKAYFWTRCGDVAEGLPEVLRTIEDDRGMPPAWNDVPSELSKRIDELRTIGSELERPVSTDKQVSAAPTESAQIIEVPTHIYNIRLADPQPRRRHKAITEPRGHIEEPRSIPDQPYEYFYDGHWQVRFDDERGTMPNDLGFQYIPKLLEKPGETVHIADLLGMSDELRREIRSKQPAQTIEGQWAIQKERERLKAKQEAAQIEGNAVEAVTIGDDIEQLDRHHQADSGLGGKPRDLNNRWAGSASKIHNALARARTKLKKAGMPNAADHFKKNIKRDGEAFIYDPALPLPWKFSQILVSHAKRD